MTKAKTSAAAKVEDDDAGAPMAGTIEYHELLEKLADPDIPESDLLPYLTTDPQHRVGMAPALLPNDRVTFNEPQSVQARARGNWVIGTLNFAARNRRLTMFNRRVAEKDRRPIIMADGDSWFQYPVYIDDTIDHLASDYTVYCMSGAGDELRRMADRIEFVDLWRNLREVRKLNVRALLISAGGNDIVGDEFRDVLHPFAAGRSARDSLNGKWKKKLDKLIEGYETLIAAMRKLDPSIPILIHAYDHANPLPDQGLTIPPRDGWLGDPMRKQGYPDGPIQAEIVKVMLEDVNIAFAKLPQRFDHVHFVDNRRTVRGRWFDELHPTNEGFAAVAANFKKKLQSLGIR